MNVRMQAVNVEQVHTKNLHISADDIHYVPTCDKQLL